MCRRGAGKLLIVGKIFADMQNRALQKQSSPSRACPRGAHNYEFYRAQKVNNWTVLNYVPVVCGSLSLSLSVKYQSHAGIHYPLYRTRSAVVISFCKKEKNSSWQTARRNESCRRGACCIVVHNYLLVVN